MDQDEPDLTGVHPLLWEKTRARIAAIEKYLKLDPPRPEDEEALAAHVGLSAPHFRRLARTWMQYRRASLLPGTTLKWTLHPGHRRRLEPDVERIISEVIEELGEQAAVTDVEQEVARRCASARIKGPHPVTVRQRLEQAWVARKVPRSEYAEPVLVIDHCAIDLPVRSEGGQITLPVVTVAVLVPEMWIVAHTTVLHTPSPQAAAAVLLAALRSSTPSAPLRPLKMAQGRTRGWADLVRILEAARITPEGRSAVQVPSGRALTKLIGHRLGELTLRPNLTHRPTAITRRSLRKMDASDLAAALGTAIAEHNRGVGGSDEAPRFSLAPRQTAWLGAQLERVATQRLEPPRARARYEKA